MTFTAHSCSQCTCTALHFHSTFKARHFFVCSCCTLGVMRFGLLPKMSALTLVMVRGMFLMLVVSHLQSAELSCLHTVNKKLLERSVFSPLASPRLQFSDFIQFHQNASVSFASPATSPPPPIHWLLHSCAVTANA